MEKNRIKADFVGVGAGFAILLLGIQPCKAEVSCFRTPAQAAVQVGEQEGGGYRLEFVRTDAFHGRSWASVRSCAHPEWPAVIVPAGGRASLDAYLSADKTVAKMGHMDVLAGRPVRVVMADAVTRLEMNGVAQNSGRVGDTVRVRILTPGNSGEEHFVDAVVRSPDVLEMGR